jgi:hypothetical protein
LGSRQAEGGSNEGGEEEARKGAAERIAETGGRWENLLKN